MIILRDFLFFTKLELSLSSKALTSELCVCQVWLSEAKSRQCVDIHGLRREEAHLPFFLNVGKQNHCGNLQSLRMISCVIFFIVLLFQSSHKLFVAKYGGIPSARRVASLKRRVASLGVVMDSESGRERASVIASRPI
jgi:hypothetical protein